MPDPAARAAAISTLRTWAIRRRCKGHSVALREMEAEAARRWPDMPIEDVWDIAAAVERRLEMERT